MAYIETPDCFVIKVTLAKLWLLEVCLTVLLLFDLTFLLFLWTVISCRSMCVIPIFVTLHHSCKRSQITDVGFFHPKAYLRCRHSLIQPSQCSLNPNQWNAAFYLCFHVFYKQKGRFYCRSCWFTFTQPYLSLHNKIEFQLWVDKMSPMLANAVSKLKVVGLSQDQQQAFSKLEL